MRILFWLTVFVGISAFTHLYTYKAGRVDGICYSIKIIQPHFYRTQMQGICFTSVNSSVNK